MVLSLNIGTVADAMSGVVANVSLKVFPILYQGAIAQYLLE